MTLFRKQALYPLSYEDKKGCPIFSGPLGFPHTPRADDGIRTRCCPSHQEGALPHEHHRPERSCQESNLDPDLRKVV
jgi:hypothetical protein